MMERFEEMELRGINNWADMPPEEQGSAIMINVDEMAELLAPSKGKSEETQEKAEFQGQCQNALESIARLGRAAQVHLVCFAQRPHQMLFLCRLDRTLLQRLLVVRYLLLFQVCYSIATLEQLYHLNHKEE